MRWILFFAAACLILFNPLHLHSQDSKFVAYSQDIPQAEIKFDLVPVPAGQFTMGSPETEAGRKKDEGPQHMVKLDAFWISSHEITWDVYELYVYRNYDTGAVAPGNGNTKQADAVTRPTKPYADMTFGMGKKNYPAVGMTHYNALQFCHWLYKRTGIFYRLPTEAEWEYACRAGSSGAYSFGEDTSQVGEYAWLFSNSKRKTHPVATKKPNAWGLYDMHGNAAEWTMDQYIPDFYSMSKEKVLVNPLSKPEKLYPHTLRGGSFADRPPALRSASRKPSDPAWKRLDPQTPKSNWWFPEAPFVGIRIVRPLQTPSAAEIAEYYNRRPIPDY